MWIRSLIAWVLVFGCGTNGVPVDDTETEASSSSSGSASSSSTTLPSTTADTTTEVASSSSGSDSSDEAGSVSTGSSSATESTSTEDSGSSSSSSESGSTSTGVEPTECVEYGEGAFGDCLAEGDEACMGSINGTCFFDDANDPQFGVCISSCDDPCDCPPPPKGFEEQLLCESIIDVVPSCFISCAGGLACPDGWTCLGDTLCMIGAPVDLDPYGDCGNLAGDCPEGMVGGPLCLDVGDLGSDEGSVCTIVGCVDADDCPAAPPTGDAVVACIDLTGEAGGDCYLDCSAAQTCPEGMECHGDLGICYFPPV